VSSDQDNGDIRQRARAGRRSKVTMAAGDVTETHFHTGPEIHNPPAQTSLAMKVMWSTSIAVAGAAVFSLVYFPYHGGTATTGSTSRAGATTASSTAGPALGITVQTRESAVENGAWLFPGKLLTGGTTLSWDGLAGDLSARSDKVDTYETTTILTVQGEQSGPVTINGMQIKILSRTPPAPGGTLLVDPPQGEDDIIKIGFDLDEPFPVARDSDLEDSGFGESFFDSHTVKLVDGEVETFGITFQAVTSDVTYDLVLDEVVNGRVTQQVVTNGSQPFHTRGFASSYDQVLAPSSQGNGWAPTDRASALVQMCGTPCTVEFVRPSATPKP